MSWNLEIMSASVCLQQGTNPSADKFDSAWTIIEPQTHVCMYECFGNRYDVVAGIFQDN